MESNSFTVSGITQLSIRSCRAMYSPYRMCFFSLKLILGKFYFQLNDITDTVTFYSRQSIEVTIENFYIPKIEEFGSYQASFLLKDFKCDSDLLMQLSEITNVCDYIQILIKHLPQYFTLNKVSKSCFLCCVKNEERSELYQKLFTDVANERRPRDFKITSENNTYYVHSFILDTEFFDCLFSKNYLVPDSLDLTEYSDKTVEGLLKYIYTGDIKSLIDEVDDIEQLLILSDFLQFSNLTRQLEKMLEYISLVTKEDN